MALVVLWSIFSAIAKAGECHYNPEIATAVIRGAAYRVVGLPHRAVRELRSALAKDSLCPQLWLLLAEAYRDMGAIDSSIAAARCALQRDSTLVETYELLAEVLAGRDVVEASRYALIAARRAPTLTNQLRAAYLLSEHDTAAAIELFRSIVAHAPFPSIIGDLVNLSLQYRDTTEAIRLLKQLLFENPDQAELARTIALLSAQQKQWDSAWKYLRYSFYHMEPVEVRETLAQWLELLGSAAPTATLLQTAQYCQTRADLSPASFLALALQLLQRSEWQSAWRLLQVAFHHPALNQAEAARAIEAIATYGNPAAAEQLLEQRDSVWHDPWVPVLRFALARTYSTAPLQQQLAFITDALSRDSTDPTALFWAAYFADSLGDQDRAVQLYERLLFFDPTNAVACNNLAYILAERNERLGYALELAQWALTIDSTRAAFLDTYGWVLHKLGRYAEARFYLERAVDHAPHPSATLFEHLGDNYDRLGFREQAQSSWKRAFELDPRRTYLLQRLR